jgi:Cytochrome c oxidase subunit IV
MGQPILTIVEVPIMSQKQQERLAQQEEEQVEHAMPASEKMEASAIPTSGDEQSAAEAPQKKRKKRKAKWVSVDEVLPKPSYWPLALTLSLCVLLMGVMIHPIVIGVGAVLVIISIIGWILEHR